MNRRGSICWQKRGRVPTPGGRGRRTKQACPSILVSVSAMSRGRGGGVAFPQELPSDTYLHCSWPCRGSSSWVQVCVSSRGDTWLALRVAEHGRWRAGRALQRIASATGPAGRSSRGGRPGMSTYSCCKRGGRADLTAPLIHFLSAHC